MVLPSIRYILPFSLTLYIFKKKTVQTKKEIMLAQITSTKLLSIYEIPRKLPTEGWIDNNQSREKFILVCERPRLNILYSTESFLKKQVTS